LKIEFKRSFVRDLKRVRDETLKERVRNTLERVEEAQSLHEVENVKKLRGGDRYYRIGLGDYRLGLMLEGDTVVFVRFLHRKDVFRYFPWPEARSASNVYAPAALSSQFVGFAARSVRFDSLGVSLAAWGVFAPIAIAIGRNE